MNVILTKTIIFHIKRYISLFSLLYYPLYSVPFQIIDLKLHMLWCLYAFATVWRFHPTGNPRLEWEWGELCTYLISVVYVCFTFDFTKCDVLNYSEQYANWDKHWAARVYAMFNDSAILKTCMNKLISKLDSCRFMNSSNYSTTIVMGRSARMISWPVYEETHYSLHFSRQSKCK